MWRCSLLYWRRRAQPVGRPGWRPRPTQAADKANPSPLGQCLECVWICLESVRESLDSVLGGLKSYQLKKLQCLSPYSTSPFYPGGLQWAKNAQKGEIENRPWPYFFSQLDPMLFRIFSLKLIKETPCGHQPVNSNFEFYHPPLLKILFGGKGVKKLPKVN